MTVETSASRRIRTPYIARDSRAAGRVRTATVEVDGAIPGLPRSAQPGAILISTDGSRFLVRPDGRLAQLRGSQVEANE